MPVQGFDTGSPELAIRWRKRLNLAFAAGIVLSGVFYLQFLPQALGKLYVIDGDHTKRVVLALSVPIEILVLIAARLFAGRLTGKTASRFLVAFILLELVANIVLLLTVSGLAST